MRWGAGALAFAGARIAHGVLLAAGCVWLAAALAKARVAELSRVT
jgi:hypothetical protein